MNALELSEIADSLVNEFPIREWEGNEPLNIMTDIAIMLRQQAFEIEELTITNQDLKYQLIKKAGEQVLNDFSKDMLLQQAKEIEQLKEVLESIIVISDRKHDAWDKAKELLNKKASKK
jgi:hypothetical protein